MKKSKTFKEAFDKLVNEASVGAGVYMPSGMSTNNSDPLSYGKQGQNPPYSSYSDISGRKNMGTGIMDQGKDETEAPKQAPYPLETSTDHLMNSYVHLDQFYALIHNSYKNEMLTNSQKEELKAIEAETEKGLKFLKGLFDRITKIRLNEF